MKKKKFLVGSILTFTLFTFGLVAHATSYSTIVEQLIATDYYLGNTNQGDQVFLAPETTTIVQIAMKFSSTYGSQTAGLRIYECTAGGVLCSSATSLEISTDSYTLTSSATVYYYSFNTAITSGTYYKIVPQRGTYNQDFRVYGDADDVLADAQCYQTTPTHCSGVEDSYFIVQKELVDDISITVPIDGESQPAPDRWYVAATSPSASAGDLVYVSYHRTDSSETYADYRYIEDWQTPGPFNFKIPIGHDLWALSNSTSTEWTATAYLLQATSTTPFPQFASSTITFVIDDEIYYYENQYTYASSSDLIGSSGIFDPSSFSVDCSAYDDVGFFSSSTLGMLGCQIKSAAFSVIQFLIVPSSDSRNFMTTRFSDFKDVFPFSVIYGVADSVRTVAETVSGTSKTLTLNATIGEGTASETAVSQTFWNNDILTDIGFDDDAKEFWFNTLLTLLIVLWVWRVIRLLTHR